MRSLNCLFASFSHLLDESLQQGHYKQAPNSSAFYVDDGFAELKRKFWLLDRTKLNSKVSSRSSNIPCHVCEQVSRGLYGHHAAKSSCLKLGVMLAGFTDSPEASNITVDLRSRKVLGKGRYCSGSEMVVVVYGCVDSTNGRYTLFGILSLSHT